MNKKGMSAVLIILAMITFTAAVVILWVSFVAIPDLGGRIGKTETTIGSDTAKSELYTLEINQINFLRSPTKNHDSTAELLIDLHSALNQKDNKKLEELSHEMDEATISYLKTYEERCVMLDVVDSNKKVIWLNAVWAQDALPCKMAGAGAFASATKTSMEIPTEDQATYLVLTQRLVPK